MSADGKWKVTFKTPVGAHEFQLVVTTSGETFKGDITGPEGDNTIEGRVSGDTLTWSSEVAKPIKLTLAFTAKVNGDAMTGNVKLGAFGNAPLSAVRV